MKRIIVYISLLLMVACRTVYVDKPIYTTIHDTVKITKIDIDSIYIKDSSSFIQKGDTVFIYKDHTIFEYKYIHDTVNKIKIDSVAYPVVEVVEKEVTYIPFWIKVLGIIGGISLGYIIFRIYRFFNNFKK